eukprot:5682326-Pyramimonas_sp.AAC.1
MSSTSSNGYRPACSLRAPFVRCPSIVSHRCRASHFRMGLSASAPLLTANPLGFRWGRPLSVPL